MKSIIHYTASILTAAALFLTLSGAGFFTACGENLHDDAETSIQEVAVHTSVRKTGQYPEKITLTLKEGTTVPDLTAEDFSLSGQAGQWGSAQIHDFSCGFSSVKAKDGIIVLVPDQFPEKYFYVKHFAVTCSVSQALSFDSTQITQTSTELADQFVMMDKDSADGFEYQLYTPEAVASPLPLVVVFHGFGDTSNLLTYRTSVAWAEPENQAVRPCYIISPVIQDANYFNPISRDHLYEKLYSTLRHMAEEGLIDGDRIYLTGNSFGGLAVLEMMEKYPDLAAAAIAMCPATSYSSRAIKQLDRLAGIPIWFAHAEHDGTISSACSTQAYNTLQKEENDRVLLTIYSDDEMNAAGADPSNDSTYSYHHVELAVLEDPAYMEWLFAQRREAAADE